MTLASAFSPQRYKQACGREDPPSRGPTTHHHAVVTPPSARKAVWLLQFFRPSLRCAVTASVSFLPENLQQQSMDCSLIVGAVWTHVWFTI